LYEYIEINSIKPIARKNMRLYENRKSAPYLFLGRFHPWNSLECINIVENKFAFLFL